MGDQCASGFHFIVPVGRFHHYANFSSEIRLHLTGCIAMQISPSSSRGYNNDLVVAVVAVVVVGSGSLTLGGTLGGNVVLLQQVAGLLHELAHGGVYQCVSL